MTWYAAADECEDGNQGGMVVVSAGCRPLRRVLKPLVWMALEEVALDAVAEDGRLVARTSARQVAERLGIDPGTAAGALRVLRERRLVALERAYGPAGRFGLSSYVLGPLAGLTVVSPGGGMPPVVLPAVVGPDVAGTNTAIPATATPRSASGHAGPPWGPAPNSTGGHAAGPDRSATTDQASPACHPCPGQETFDLGRARREGGGGCLPEGVAGVCSGFRVGEMTVTVGVGAGAVMVVEGAGVDGDGGCGGGGDGC